MDVISVHAYNYGDNDVEYKVSDTDDTTVKKDLKLYMAEAKRLGKPLYDGETGLACIYVEYDDETFEREALEEYLQETIDAGVQLTHWWAFHTDRAGHDSEDTYAWNMDFGQGLEVMANANRAIKAKYCVNGIKEYSSSIWEEDYVPYEIAVTTVEAEEASFTYLIYKIGAIVIASAAVAVLVVIVLKNKKKQGKIHNENEKEIIE